MLLQQWKPKLTFNWHFADSNIDLNSTKELKTLNYLNGQAIYFAVQFHFDGYQSRETILSMDTMLKNLTFFLEPKNCHVVHVVYHTRSFSLTSMYIESKVGSMDVFCPLGKL